MTKEVLENLLTRNMFTFVNEPFHGAQEVWNLALADPNHDAAALVAAAHFGEHAVPKIIHRRVRWNSDEILAGLRWLTASTASESAGSAVQGEFQHVELSGAVLGPHNYLHSYVFLQETLADLDALGKAATEDDLPEPDPEAVANARSLLPKLYKILPVRYRVTPTERRGVAIDAPMRHGAAVAVECAPDDTVYCFATIDGNSRRAKFYQMDGLPDVFIEKALRDIAAG